MFLKISGKSWTAVDNFISSSSLQDISFIHKPLEEVCGADEYFIYIYMYVCVRVGGV